MAAWERWEAQWNIYSCRERCFVRIFMLFSSREPLIQIQLVQWFVGAVNSCLEKIVAICFIIFPFPACLPCSRSLSFHTVLCYIKHAVKLMLFVSEGIYQRKALEDLSLFDTRAACSDVFICAGCSLRKVLTFISFNRVTLLEAFATNDEAFVSCNRGKLKRFSDRFWMKWREKSSNQRHLV